MNAFLLEQMLVLFRPKSCTSRLEVVFFLHLWLFSTSIHLVTPELRDKTNCTEGGHKYCVSRAAVHDHGSTKTARGYI